MTTATLLDPKFAKIITLMESTEHDGERTSARERAAAVAASCGMTFDEAMKDLRKPTSAPFDFMGGFGDHMEAKQPGWKAERAAERAERDKARFERRMTALEKYGNREAALAPCAKEKLLHAALKPWVKYCRKPHQRWTESVDDLGDNCLWGMGDHIRKAVAEAYPVPTTFAGALAEYDYWRVRRQEMEDVLGPDNYGDTGLDRPAQYRMDLVDDMVRHELPLTTLADITARLAAYIDFQGYPDKAIEAVHRDLDAIASREAAAKANQDGSVCPDPSASDHIEAALRADPARSDRHVARACGCSPTTVGKIRRQLGLVQAARSVHRRGQTYTLNVGA